MFALAIAQRYAALERDLAEQPANDASREAMLELMLGGHVAATVPGCSLALPSGSVRPRVAVLTPYYREPVAVLRQCAASVRAQTVPTLHIMVADGFPEPAVDTWPIRHVRLPSNHGDHGDTPRAIAAAIAVAEGCRMVAYLDADNVWRPRHLESLIARHLATGAAVCHSGRTLHGKHGELLPMLEAGDNVTHVDTNCILVSETAFDLLARWGRWPKPLSIIGDRIFWASVVASGVPRAFTGALTTAYTADRAGHYRAINAPVPADARAEMDFTGMLRWYDALDQPHRDALDRELRVEIQPLVEARRPRRHPSAAD